MPEPLWVTRLKRKWNIRSNFEFLRILLVFSLAGASIGFIRRPIFHVLGITPQTSLWIKTAVYLPLIPPIYQINLLIYGFLLGCFDFFWEKEKKLGRVLKRVFQRH